MMEHFEFFKADMDVSRRAGFEHRRLNNNDLQDNHNGLDTSPDFGNIFKTVRQHDGDSLVTKNEHHESNVENEIASSDPLLSNNSDESAAEIDETKLVHDGKPPRKILIDPKDTDQLPDKKVKPRNKKGIDPNSKGENNKYFLLNKLKKGDLSDNGRSKVGNSVTKNHFGKSLLGGHIESLDKGKMKADKTSVNKPEKADPVESSSMGRKTIMELHRHSKFEISEFKIQRKLAVQMEETIDSNLLNKLLYRQKNMQFKRPVDDRNKGLKAVKPTIDKSIPKTKDSDGDSRVNKAVERTVDKKLVLEKEGHSKATSDLLKKVSKPEHSVESDQQKKTNLEIADSSASLKTGSIKIASLVRGEGLAGNRFQNLMQLVEIISKHQQSLAGSEKIPSQLQMQINSTQWGKLEILVSEGSGSLNLLMQTETDNARQDLSNQREELERYLLKLGYDKINLDIKNGDNQKEDANNSTETDDNKDQFIVFKDENGAQLDELL